MATIYERPRGSRRWYISYFFEGRRITKRLRLENGQRVLDKAVARQLQKQLELNLARGRHQETQRIELEAYLEAYSQDTDHRKDSTNTHQSYTVKKFLRTCAHVCTLQAFRREHVLTFLRPYEQKRPATYNAALIAVKRFFRLAVREGVLLKNPAAGIALKPLARGAPRFLTDEEYQRLEAAAAHHPLYPMIVTARYTGLRLGELRHLEWIDFDWMVNTVRVVQKPQFSFTTKNYQERVVPIGRELRDKLLPYVKPDGLCFPSPKTGQPYAQEGPKKALKRLLRHAGIRAKGWHCLRHTFASRLVQRNVPIYKVSRWLGHSRVTVTEIYARLAPSYDPLIERLNMEDTPVEDTRSAAVAGVLKTHDVSFIEGAQREGMRNGETG